MQFLNVAVVASLLAGTALASPMPDAGMPLQRRQNGICWLLCAFEEIQCPENWVCPPSHFTYSLQNQAVANLFAGPHSAGMLHTEQAPCYICPYTNSFKQGECWTCCYYPEEEDDE